MLGQWAVDVTSASLDGKQSRTPSKDSACASTVCASSASSSSRSQSPSKSFTALDNSFTALDNVGVGLDVRALVPQRVNAGVHRRYNIDKKEIGSGGYGSVFTARDQRFTDRVVAIKKVVCGNRASKVAIDNEIVMMKLMDHPSICKLFEVYEEAGVVYLIMEHCEGGELYDRISDKECIPEVEVADIVKQLAGAVNYAHLRNVCHRDIKPENVCFCKAKGKSTEVKLIDWGLAAFGGSTDMTASVGSLTYSAPEVHEVQFGQPYTSSCDLWGLGVTTYVSLCGKPPFWGSHRNHLRTMNEEKYPMPDKFSADAKHFIRGLLKADPNQRTPISDVMSHPFVQQARATPLDKAAIQQVFSNMQRSSGYSRFHSICAASVARQLGHQHLEELQRVFCEIDTNGDGTLEFAEVQSSFEKIYGAGSHELMQVEQMFVRLDLDKSGRIDYTEFCAAGLGEHMGAQEHGIWSAFKAFDIGDDDELISEDEIRQAISTADVSHSLPQTVCEQVAREVIAKFDANNDGSLDFLDFQNMMQIPFTPNSRGARTSVPQVGVTHMSVTDYLGRFLRFANPGSLRLNRKKTRMQIHPELPL